MELPRVGSATLGLESPEHSTQQVLAVLTPTLNLDLCRQLWHQGGGAGTQCTEWKSFPIRAGVEVREPDRLEERRRQGWKVGGGWDKGPNRSRLGVQYLVSGRTEQHICTPVLSTHRCLAQGWCWGR